MTCDFGDRSMDEERVDLPQRRLRRQRRVALRLRNEERCATACEGSTDEAASPIASRSRNPKRCDARSAWTTGTSASTNPGSGPARSPHGSAASHSPRLREFQFEVRVRNPGAVGERVPVVLRPVALRRAKLLDRLAISSAEDRQALLRISEVLLVALRHQVVTNGDRRRRHKANLARELPTSS